MLANITNMQIRRWNKRHMLMLGGALLVLYWIFSASRNTYEAEVIIKNTKPEHVWEYVADFHKMRLLNPTILDFKITKDEGNFEHWRYSVVYRERLSHWPYWINVADADYSVKKLASNKYLVASTHRTCFFAGLYCLYSTGEFIFIPSGSDTRSIEIVNYECPPFMGPMCRREVEFQRKAIMENLSVHFTKKSF